MRARLSIDSEKCQGHQVCAAMMPDLFGCDELGYGTVEGADGDGLVDPARWPGLPQVVRNCPEQAITLQEQ